MPIDLPDQDPFGADLDELGGGLPPPPLPVLIDRRPPPSILGRLYAGNDRVPIDGATGPVRLVLRTPQGVEVVASPEYDAGTSVVLLFALLPLEPDDVLYAECQDPDGTWNRGSGHLVARQPPTGEAPRIGLVRAGAQVVRVTRVPSGSVVVLMDASGFVPVVVGSAYADPDGVARVTPTVDLAGGDVVYAVVSYGGSSYASEWTAVRAQLARWDAPTPELPVFGGQSHVWLKGLRVGFDVWFSVDGTPAQTSGPAADPEGWVELPFAVRGGDLVECWQEDQDGAESDRVAVAVEVGTLSPRILPTVTRRTRTLRIERQVPGHELHITLGDNRWVRPSGSQLEVDIGQAASILDIEVAQVGPITTRTGDPVSTATARAAIPVVFPPFAGTVTVVVGLVLAGTMVAVYRVADSGDDILLGAGWAGERGSAVVEVFPVLSEGELIYALSWNGDDADGALETSLPSATIPVQPLPDELPTAEILPPAWRGDNRVVIAGNLAGSMVTIEWSADGGETWESLGGHILPDPHGVVHIDPIPEEAGLLRAVTNVGDDLESIGDPMAPVDDPGVEGPHLENSEWISAPDGTFLGHFYFPAQQNGTPDLSAPDPLLLIAVPGDAPLPNPAVVAPIGLPAPPVHGYGWLARHLATRGIFTVSLIRGADDGAVIDQALAELADRYGFVPARLQLFAHSFGALSIYQWVQGGDSRIRGVITVGLQASVWGAPVGSVWPCMAIAGSHDYYVSSLSDFQFNQGPVLRVSPVGINHNGWNRWWAALGQANGTDGKDWPEGSLSEAAHHRFGKALFGLWMRFAEDIDGYWRAFATNPPPDFRFLETRFALANRQVACLDRTVDLTNRLESGDPHDANALGGDTDPFPDNAEWETLINGPAAIEWTFGRRSGFDEELQGLVPDGGTSWVLHANATDAERGRDCVLEVRSAERVVWLRFQGLPFPRSVAQYDLSVEGITGTNLLSALAALPLRAVRGADPLLDPTTLELVGLRGAGLDQAPATVQFPRIALWCLP